MHHFGPAQDSPVRYPCGPNSFGAGWMRQVPAAAGPAAGSTGRDEGGPVSPGMAGARTPGSMAAGCGCPGANRTGDTPPAAIDERVPVAATAAGAAETAAGAGGTATRPVA